MQRIDEILAENIVTRSNGLLFSADERLLNAFTARLASFVTIDTLLKLQAQEEALEGLTINAA